MSMFTNKYYSEQQKQLIFKEVRPSKGRAMDGSGESSQFKVHQITFSSYLVRLSGNWRLLLPPDLTSRFSCCQMKLVLRDQNWTAAAAVLGTGVSKGGIPASMGDRVQCCWLQLPMQQRQVGVYGHFCHKPNPT